MAIANVPSINETLSGELILSVFDHLDGEDLAQVSRVCSLWRTLASTPALWKNCVMRLPVRTFGPAEWERIADLNKHGLSFENTVEDPNKDYRAAFIVLRKLASEVEGNAGITYIIPPKGLDLEKMIEIAGEPKEGNKTGLAYIWDHARVVLGKVPIENRPFFITNGVLKSSRNISVKKQQAMVSKLGCEMPKTIEAVTLCFLTYVLSKDNPPTRLFSDSPWTYTSCQERIVGLQLIVGGFCTGLCVRVSRTDNDKDGMGAVWKWLSGDQSEKTVNKD